MLVFPLKLDFFIYFKVFLNFDFFWQEITQCLHVNDLYCLIV